jgi:aspartokinase-like uncharacterized kinase
MSRVVKLGGSLLDLPALAMRLRDWLERQTSASTALIVGGGRLADVLREADRLHGLGESPSHWLCLRAMTIHAEMLAAMLPEACLIRSLADWRTRPPASLSILDPWSFMREEEPRLPGGALPESWLATSDSISARFARGADARELALLKSELPPSGATLAEAAQAGYVDPLLPRFGGDLPAIRCVNLRADDFPERVWRISGR